LQSGETAQALARAAGWRFHYDEEYGISCWWHPRHGRTFPDAMDVVEALNLDSRTTYRNFRKTVQHGFDCLMVKVSGMWVGIEKDGYTHT
jgi:hypothetical protein